MTCPLCAAPAELFFSDTAIASADFHHCPTCDLIFKSPDVHLGSEAEHARYALHQNLGDDQGYVKFLRPAADAVVKSVSAGASGLDYGCGPGPVLSELLSAEGFTMRVYDPYFANELSVLQTRYDFITCTEVAEHFYRPSEDFAKIFELLKASGTLVLMTGLHRGREAFKTWKYRIDPTHVCFYSPATLAWIAEKFEARIEYVPDSLVVILNRSSN